MSSIGAKHVCSHVTLKSKVHRLTTSNVFFVAHLMMCISLGARAPERPNASPVHVNPLPKHAESSVIACWMNDFSAGSAGAKETAVASGSDQAKSYRRVGEPDLEGLGPDLEVGRARTALIRQ